MYADLHRHLDGSLRPATVADLAAERGLAVPSDLRFERGMGLQACLDRFAFTLTLLDTLGAIRRVAAEMCEDAEQEGVTTLEIRFAPQLHGPPPGEVVDAVLAGVEGRAGLILCGLYGEDPAVLEHLVDLAAKRAGVVGLDLAGGPSSGHDFSMAHYAGAFRRAAALGIGRTVHAGEGRPPSEIRDAILVLGAQRVGHGTTLLDDPAVVDLVVERGITIEACPTSNVHTGVLDDVAAHPLARWLALGVRATVCTDNTLLSDTTIPEELQRVRTIPGMDDARLAAAVRFGHEAAFPARTWRAPWASSEALGRSGPGSAIPWRTIADPEGRTRMSLDDLSREDRLRLVRFVCSFAWADLQVVAEERALVHDLVRRLELDEDERRQVEAWLVTPPGMEQVDPTDIPREHREIFLEHVKEMVAVDGVIDPDEAESVALFEALLG